MFAGRFSSTTGAVGIDFGSSGVKMLQAREKAGRIEVVGAALIDMRVAHAAANADVASDVQIGGGQPGGQLGGQPGVEASGEMIRAAYASGGFTGPRCVVSLAREDVHLQSIRLPRMPDDELRQTALWEASQRFGLDRNAMEVDFTRTGATLATGSAENREEVILVAASHAAINARVEPVLAAGLRPIAVEAGFSALVRVFSRHARRESDRVNVRAVVEVGESGTTVLILRGDQVAFCKPIAIGGRLFNLAVADHLQMTEQQASDLRASRIAAIMRSGPANCGVAASNDASASPCNGVGAAGAAATIAPIDPATDRAVYESVRPLIADLVKEVTLCLRYYGVTFRGHPPDRIILTGGDGLEPRLSSVMSGACKTPVVFDDASNTLESVHPGIHHCLNRTPGPAASWAVALGLSMRGMKRTSNAVVHETAAPHPQEPPIASGSKNQGNVGARPAAHAASWSARS